MGHPGGGFANSAAKVTASMWLHGSRFGGMTKVLLLLLLLLLGQKGLKRPHDDYCTTTTTTCTTAAINPLCDFEGNDKT